MNKYYVLQTIQYGRGIYANTKLKAGDVLFHAELIVFNEKDTKIVNTTDLQCYTFKYDDKRDCLVLGDGELFNHSDTPDVSYELLNINDRHVMKFTLLRDVNSHEQLFIDYAADTKVDPSAYTTNMVG